MIPAVLVLATLAFRALGALGVRRFASWPVSAAHGMAVMLLFTASAHFVPASVTVMPNHADLARMVPPFLPFADALVYVTGVLEFLGAAGLVLTATRWPASIGLAALFVTLLPANIYAATGDVAFANGEPATPLWQRIPEQLLYLAVALWIARAADSTPTRELFTRREKESVPS
ncbi:DoxX family protein [Kribbella sp. CA-247076]|uniref:DoxX family protein n=1 Tax=Kribbella sp. CA-247076 TaxID=3239941 RepID=UPI003D8BEBDA